MTQKRAARIMGLEVRHLGQEYHAMDGERSIAVAKHRDPKRALQMLVNMVYRMRSERVILAQGGRCSQCGKFGPLEIDHIKPRARGDRDDRIENLHAVCAGMTGCDYHRKKHGG